MNRKAYFSYMFIHYANKIRLTVFFRLENVDSLFWVSFNDVNIVAVWMWK